MTARIVVHVGPGKTGSSALQQWLTTHHDALLAAGVLYPAHGLDRNGVSSGNRAELMDIVPGEGRDVHVVSAAKAGALRATLEESGCHTLLLSSEFFYPAITDIQREFPDAEFVLYLRDPIELTESNYNQSVKRHDQTKAFTTPRTFRAGVFAQLPRLLGAASPPRLLLRPYGERLFVGGDIVRDLLSVLGVSGFEPEVARVNASYTFDALEFKRHANFFALGPLQPSVDTTLQSYSVGPREYSLIPPDKFEAMRADCLEQLDELIRAHSLAELHHLRDDLAAAEQRLYLPQEATREQLFGVADYLELEQPETFARLHTQVRQTPGLLLPNPGFYARFAEPLLFP